MWFDYWISNYTQKAVSCWQNILELSKTKTFMFNIGFFIFFYLINWIISKPCYLAFQQDRKLNFMYMMNKNIF